LFKRKTFYKGCYEAVQDIHRAIIYFKKNAHEYAIDTNRIILAGNSAGAMIAIQYVYGDQDELRKMAKRKNVAVPLSPAEPPRISAVINFWGAIFDKDWLANADIPIVSVHGKKDRLVPFRAKKTHMYGSYAIHQHADSLDIPNRLKVYERHAHELYKHFIPIAAGTEIKERWLEAGQFAAEFLSDQLFNDTSLDRYVDSPIEIK
jgi:acetyl esterase/lipase